MSDENTQATTTTQQPAPRRESTAQPGQPTLPTINVTPSVPTEFLAQLEREKIERQRVEAEWKKSVAATDEIKSQLAALAEKAQQSEASAKKEAAERRAEKIRYEARQAAMAAGAVDPDDVVALTLAQFTVDDAGKVVTTETTPRDAATFVKDYLAKKPHLAAPLVAKGSGSSPFVAPAPAVIPQGNHNIYTREGATAQLHENLLRAAARKTA